MAELDARHGSPLAADQVALQLTRMEPWRAGRPGRFSVVYTRTAPGRAGARESQGRWADLFTSVLPSSGIRATQALSAKLPAGLVYLAAALLFTFTIMTAWRQRIDAADELDQLQRRVDVAERRAINATAAKRLADEVMALGLRDHSGSHVLSDMAWISGHLTTDAHVQAVHWRDGVIAVEVSGVDTPFAAPDRRIQRASKPLRSGAWLWGVEPQTCTGQRGR